MLNQTRYYHAWHHIDYCLKMLRKHSDLAEHYDEITAALMFHDYIYDTHVPDECNVLRSANVARETLSNLISEKEKLDRISGCVLSTTHKREPNTNDEALTMDIDLSMLTAYAPEAIEFMIRKEYEWVPLPKFTRARKNILIELFLRDHIYHTETFRKLYEVETRHRILKMIRYNGMNAVVAGTFDLFHKGHSVLIKSALEFAGNYKNSHLTIGITSDEMASKKSHPVQPFEVRKRSISNFITRRYPRTQWEIMLLNDPLGDAATNPNYDVLIASKETQNGAEKVNKARVKNGLSPLIIHLIEIITDGTGERISSTRLRQ